MLFAGEKNYLFHCRDKEIWLGGEENIRGRDKNHGLNGSVGGQHVILRGCLHDKSSRPRPNFSRLSGWHHSLL